MPSGKMERGALLLSRTLVACFTGWLSCDGEEGVGVRIPGAISGDAVA